MLNVVTVHWLSAKWIPTQLDYLDRNAGGPYRVFASLNGIEDPEIRRRFHYARDIETNSHPEKLNLLSQVVMEDSKPEDRILFLDGDAFPVQPLEPWVGETLEQHGLAAIQRRENAEDTRPHPSFCVSTVGFWKEHGLDWTPEDWVTPTGHLFQDAGGRLARQLEAHGVDWLPMVRSNTDDLHPLWFAVYGHRVYHHGAGFRPRVSKVDQLKNPALYAVNFAWDGPSLGQLAVAVKRDPSLILKARPKSFEKVVSSARRTALRRFARWHGARAESESDEVFERILADPKFYLEFDSTLV